nr:DUF6485 family protein [Candidatus Sigynarchaeota archaeon]
MVQTKNCENDASTCTCSYDHCSRHGKCCECVRYHKSKDELPGCFFSREGEQKYDRSIVFFIQDYTKRKKEGW